MKGIASCAGLIRSRSIALIEVVVLVVLTGVLVRVGGPLLPVLTGGLDLAEKHNGLLTLLATMGLLYVTYHYTRLTEAMRDAQTEPCVVVWLDAIGGGSGFPQLVLDIVNAGAGVARDVRFAIDPEPEALCGPVFRTPLSQRGCLRTGISHLAPRQTRRIVLGPVSHQEGPWDTQFTVHVTFANESSGRAFKQSYEICLSELAWVAVADEPLARIAEATKTIASELQRQGMREEFGGPTRYFQRQVVPGRPAVDRGNGPDPGQASEGQQPAALASSLTAPPEPRRRSRPGRRAQAREHQPNADNAGAAGEMDRQGDDHTGASARE